MNENYNNILCIQLNPNKRKEFKIKGCYFMDVPKKSNVIYKYKANIKFDDLASLAQLIQVDEENVYNRNLYNFIKDYPTKQIFYVFDNDSVYAMGEFTNEPIIKDGKIKRKATFPKFKACKFPKGIKNVGEFSFRISKYFRQEFLDSRLETKKKEEKIQKLDESAKESKKSRKRTPKIVTTITTVEGTKIIDKNGPTIHEIKEIEQEIKKHGDVVTLLYKSSKYQYCIEEIKRRLAVESTNTNTKTSLAKKVEGKEIIRALQFKDDYSPIISRTNCYDFKYLLKEDVIGRVELIEDVYSNNRHLSHDFDLNGVIKDFAYEDISGNINLVKLSVFYCETCDVYFDYIESYKAQLKKANIPLIKVITKHVDNNGREIVFGDTFNWKEESTLKHFGYSVGYSGISQSRRQEILKFVINNHFMTVNEVKSLLNQFISYNGQKSGNEKAKRDWENDLAFVNDMLINKRNNG